MQLPKRKSIRLPGYDYSQSGYYFITICTQNRKFLCGNIADNKIVLNDIGKIVENVWWSLPKHHSVELDIYQIMPNHIHFIIIVPTNDNSGFARKTPTGFGHVTPNSLSCIVRSFKSETTKQIRRLIENPNLTIWQRNYYEHIIRNACPAEPHHEPCSNRTRRRMARFCGDDELNKIREYIKSNPTIWNRDRNNPIIRGI